MSWSKRRYQRWPVPADLAGNWCSAKRRADRQHHCHPEGDGEGRAPHQWRNQRGRDGNAGSLDEILQDAASPAAREKSSAIKVRLGMASADPVK